MTLLARVVVLVLAGMASAPSLAAAGVIEERPVVEIASLVYRDDLEFDDGFRVLERLEGGETELVFERTTGTQPLRSVRPGCVTENDDLVRCRDLGQIKTLQFRLIAGEDVADASGVRSFAVRADSGSGDATLTGGALGDRLYSDNGNDTLAGGPGDDRLESGTTGARAADRDTLDGGPGRDTMLSGDDRDTVFAQDGERDRVDCGAGDDFVTADALDELVGCEIARLPRRSEPAQPVGPGPAPDAGPAAPAGTPAPAPATSPVMQAARARTAVTIRCVRRGVARIAARRAGDFAPAALRVTATRGRVVRRGALKVDVRTRRRATIRATVNGRDGSRLLVRRALPRC